MKSMDTTIKRRVRSRRSGARLQDRTTAVTILPTLMYASWYSAGDVKTTINVRPSWMNRTPKISFWIPACRSATRDRKTPVSLMRIDGRSTWSSSKSFCDMSEQLLFGTYFCLMITYFLLGMAPSVPSRKRKIRSFKNVSLVYTSTTTTWLSSRWFTFRLIKQFFAFYFIPFAGNFTRNIIFVNQVNKRIEVITIHNDDRTGIIGHEF